MAKVFYINEILNFAVEKEQESFELYKKLHDLSPDSQMKEIFKELMNQEKQHELFYKDMLSHIKDDGKSGLIEDGTYQLYMKELIQRSKQESLLSNIDLADHDKALNFGIAREKDSILFYVGLKNFISNESKSMIDKIIGEEVKHMVLLAKMKEQ